MCCNCYQLLKASKLNVESWNCDEIEIRWKIGNDDSIKNQRINGFREKYVEENRQKNELVFLLKHFAISKNQTSPGG